MNTNHVEYIQDIAFNDICDKMAICTTSKKIIIYQKVLKKSNDLIIIDEQIKAEIRGKKNNNKSSRNNFHNTIGFLNSTEKKRRLKEKSNINLQSKLNPNLNDSIELKAKLASSKSLISIETQDTKKRKKSEKIDDNEEDNNDFYFLNRNSNNNLFKSINFGRKSNYKLDKSNYGGININDFNNDSFESLNNSLKHTKKKEYDYRWEKIKYFDIDGPGLRLQWANSEFGNIIACSGYNKCVYIIKEDNDSWTKIKEFIDIVEDISFVPRNDILELATITSDGYLKTFQFLVTNSWELNHILNISKSKCTCLCCNPSNLDKLTIVVGCKKPFNDEIKNDKNNLNDDTKLKQSLKKQDIIKNNKSNDLIKIVYFRDKNTALTGVINDGHEDDITDVDWANQNGRLHHII